MTAPVTAQSAVAAPQAPFEIPNIVMYAVPFFVLLILIEMVLVRVTKKGRYEARDSAASLSMGFGNRVFGIAFGGFAVLAYFAVYEFRLFTLGWTWPVMVACFFAEDLAYYWFHRIAHERRFFWASHIVHHSSQHYNLSTALRQTWTGTLGISPLVGTTLRVDPGLKSDAATQPISTPSVPIRAPHFALPPAHVRATDGALIR